MSANLLDIQDTDMGSIKETPHLFVKQCLIPFNFEKA